MLTGAPLFTSRYITMQAADNCLVEHTAVLFSPSSVPHYVVFYVQHKLGAGHGGNTADASVYRFSIGFGSLNDNSSFVCLQPDSLL